MAFVDMPLVEPPESVKAQGLYVSRFWLHGYWDGLAGVAGMEIHPDHFYQTAYLQGFSVGRDALIAQEQNG